MAHTGAGVDIVVPERSTDHLLHDPHFFVGGARGGDTADGFAAVFGLNFLKTFGAELDGLVPAHFLPGIGGLVADHRLEYAFLMRGVAPGETAFHAGVALIGLAALRGHHAHNFLAFHFGVEGAAHAAIGAGGFNGIVGRAHRDHGFFVQRCGRAGLDTGAARYAL